jgi:hypothetical protein
MRAELLEDWRTLGQLALLCQCDKAVELKRLGCCRSCYDRRQHSLHFFNGMRERVLKRDGFRCRACGTGSPLLVHHRATDSEERTLITLCIRCHIRVHRWRWFRHRVSATLVQLWTERHAGAPLQLQLPLRTASEIEVREGQFGKQGPSQPNLFLGEKHFEQQLGNAEALVGQDNRLGRADRI